MVLLAQITLKIILVLSTHWKLGANIIPLSIHGPIHFNTNEFPHKEDLSAALSIYIVCIDTWTCGVYVCQQYQNYGHDQMIKHLSFSKDC